VRDSARQGHGTQHEHSETRSASCVATKSVSCVATVMSQLFARRQTQACTVAYAVVGGVGGIGQRPVLRAKNRRAARWAILLRHNTPLCVVVAFHPVASLQSHSPPTVTPGSASCCAPSRENVWERFEVTNAFPSGRVDACLQFCEPVSSALFGAHAKHNALLRALH
jgi:hypothetical protein